RRRHTRFDCDWSSDVCSSDLKRSYLAFVGTYTTKTASKGIYAFRYDANSGKLTPIGVAAETPDPSWVGIHPNGKFLYAANEAGKIGRASCRERGETAGGAVAE